MNMQAFRAELSACPEASSSRLPFSAKGERYLVSKVFYPFSAEPGNTYTDDLDFSAFTIEELFSVYADIDEYCSLLPHISRYAAVYDSIGKTKPYAAQAVFL